MARLFAVDYEALGCSEHDLVNPRGAFLTKLTTQVKKQHTEIGKGDLVCHSGNNYRDVSSCIWDGEACVALACYHGYLSPDPSFSVTDREFALDSGIRAIHTTPDLAGPCALAASSIP